MMAATWAMRDASPSEVPPNFITIIWPVLFLAGHALPRTKRRERFRSRLPIRPDWFATISRAPPDRQAR
jgi:hypothetical protein